MNSGNIDQGTGRFLLSGASGMLGSAVGAEFRTRRAQVIQLVRRAPAGAEELRWDPEAASPIRDTQALEGLDAAIHLSGSNLAAHRWTPEYRREMTASRINSTRALATTLAGLRHPPRALLAASAIGIYGNRGDEVLDENSAPGSGFLADVCQAWENATQPAAAAGIRVVHMRFGVVLAPGSGALAKMLPIFRFGLGGRLGSGKQWMSWIGVGDLVAAVLFVLDSTSVAGAVNFTSPQPVTNAGFTRALARQLHRPAVLPAPAFALRLALGTMADEALLSSARALPRKLLNAGFRFSQGSIEESLTHVNGK
jgi:uncharacterized protein (TIGR01777 family)